MIALQSEAFGMAIGASDMAVVRAGGEPAAMPLGCPPATLLPRLVGDPVTSSLSDRLDARGTALPWPPTARVDESSGAARLPAPMAWLCLEQNDRTWQWIEAPGKPPHVLRASEAIASLVADAVGYQRESEDTVGADVAVVVPNTLTLDQQDRLLHALRLRGMRAFLLWRPVAAALSWLETYAGNLHPTLSDGALSTGRVLSLYLGVESFEADVLEIIPRRIQETDWLLPARSLPKVPTLYAVGLRAIEQVAHEAVGGDREAAWHRLWATRWLRDSLSDPHATSTKIAHFILEPRRSCPLSLLRQSLGGHMSHPSRSNLAVA